MSTRVPLHHNGRNKPWTKRSAERIDLWTTMASLNPQGFRQPRSGKHHKGRGIAPKTHLDRIFDLEQKLA